MLVEAAARRPASGSRCSTRSTSPPASARRPRARRCATATASSRRGPTGSTRWTPTSARPARRALGVAVHSVRAVPAADARRRSPRWVGGRPFHVHLSEQVAENDGLPRGVRRHARRGCSPTTACWGRRRALVHATHLTDDDIALIGGAGAYASLLPDHRARPRRRHRAVAGALHDAGARADPRLRQPRRDRPLRGDARGRARRAAGHPAARPLDRRRAADRRHHRRARVARLGRRRRHRRRAARRPRRRSTRPARAPPAPAATRTPSSSPPSAEDVQPGDGRRPVGRRGGRPRTTIGRELDGSRRPHLGRGPSMSTTVITGIGELVTNDPARAEQGGLLGLVARRRGRGRGQPGRLGRSGRRGARRRRPGRRRRARGDPRLRRLATATSSSPATAPPSSRRG